MRINEKKMLAKMIVFGLIVTFLGLFFCVRATNLSGEPGVLASQLTASGTPPANSAFSADSLFLISGSSPPRTVPDVLNLLFAGLAMLMVSVVLRKLTR